MKKYIPFILLCFSFFPLSSQLNTEFVSQLGFSEGLNDIWGYVAPDGTEYAVVGTRRRTSFVSLKSPSNPEVVAEILGAQSIWRDMKTYEEYGYTVADQGRNGLLIMDLTALPDSVSHRFWNGPIEINGVAQELNTCHNLYMADGYLYLSGCNVSSGGVLILDVKTAPLNPTYVGAANLNYSHDVFVRDTLLFASEINRGQLGIYSVADKSAPRLLATQATSFTFTHNAWSSEDNKYVFTTDERANAFLDAYDISDLDQIEKVDIYQVLSTKGRGVIPHNTHWHNGYLVTSWYTDGVIVIDANRPENLVRVAQYDTWQGGDGGFNGCWGAYPYLPSGLVIASDIDNGLYVLDVDYKRAAYLEGKVKDLDSGIDLNGALVRILSDDQNEAFSNASGEYKTGQVSTGTFKAVASKAGYFPDTAMINLMSGEVTAHDFELSTRKQYDLEVIVTDQVSGEALRSVNVLVETDVRDYNGMSNLRGSYAITAVEGKNTIYVGKLGYKTQRIDFNLSEGSAISVALEKGLEDDFVFDYGWRQRGTAVRGAWTRSIPEGTIFGEGLLSNPDRDSPDDVGEYAFVTGKNASDVSSQDVDEGVTTLMSPMFDISTIENPEIEYSSWFYNGGGDESTLANDYLEIHITNGTDTVLIESIRDTTRQSGRWRPKSIHNITEHLGATTEVKVLVSIADDDPQHLVEGGFDDFAIVSGNQTSTSTQEETAVDEVKILPNPFGSSFLVSGNNVITRYALYDIIGREVISDEVDSKEFRVMDTGLTEGIYMLRIAFADGRVAVKRVVKE